MSSYSSVDGPGQGITIFRKLDSGWNKGRTKANLFSKMRGLISCSGLTESTLYGAIRLVLRAVCSGPGMCLYFRGMEVLILVCVQYESRPSH